MEGVKPKCDWPDCDRLASLILRGKVYCGVHYVKIEHDEWKISEAYNDRRNDSCSGKRRDFGSYQKSS